MEQRTVTATTPARSRRLATVAALRADLGISGSGEDVRLGALLDRASGRLAGPEFFGFLPLRQSYSIRQAGSGRQRMYPGVYPLESVSAVTRDGQAVDSSEYLIGGELREYLFRETGWLRDAYVHADVTEEPRPATATPEYVLTLTAGWVPPELLGDWTAAAEHSIGDWVRSVATPAVLRFEATAVTGAGASGATEPTWPTVVGETVVDGEVAWIARAAGELPDGIQEAALTMAADAYHRTSRDPAVASLRSGSKGVAFRSPGELARAAAVSVGSYLL